MKSLIEISDISKHSSFSFSIEDINGLINIDKYNLNSCLFIYVEQNFPKNDESLKKSSIKAEFIGAISSANNLYINNNNSSCSGFGINILS